MAVSKAEDGRWYSKFRYKDWTGKTVQKKKTGFKTKKEAQAWEAEFLKSASGSPDMTFNSLWELYKADLWKRVKSNTAMTRVNNVELHILPTFKDIPVSSITPIMVRTWYYKLSGAERTKRGYVWNLSSILNYGVKFYGVAKNPVPGTIPPMVGAKEMQFYTLGEYQRFIKCVENRTIRCMLDLLFYSGMRIGELQALTLNDVDFNKDTIRINKTYNRPFKTIQSPKTPSSVRTISMPRVIMDELVAYCDKRYKLELDERLFTCSLPTISRAMKEAAMRAEVKPIRVHDLRHSHASLLVDMGLPILAISKRLGHANPSMTLNIYSHLYESKQADVINKLNEVAEYQ